MDIHLGGQSQLPMVEVHTHHVSWKGDAGDVVEVYTHHRIPTREAIGRPGRQEDQEDRLVRLVRLVRQEDHPQVFHTPWVYLRECSLIELTWSIVSTLTLT